MAMETPIAGHIAGLNHATLTQFLDLSAVLLHAHGNLLAEGEGSARDRTRLVATRKIANESQIVVY